MITHQNALTAQLKTLHLSGISQTLDMRLRQATDERWAASELLSRLFADEIEQRDQRLLETRIRRANIMPDKTIDQFDFSFNPTLNQALIMELATCQFVAKKSPVIIAGPTGTGKTHLGQAFAHQACVKGYTVLYIGCAGLLASLMLAHVQADYSRRLKSFLKPHLLVIDDFGLKQLRDRDSEHFYDVIAGRYQTAATVITSNHALDEWPELFGDPLLASSGLDRLFHNATVITISGDSFRARNRTTALSLKLKQSQKGTAPMN
jgi:DNA replication protein DnaC